MRFSVCAVLLVLLFSGSLSAQKTYSAAAVLQPEAADNTDALQALLTRVEKSGGGTVTLPRGTFRFRKPVFVWSNTQVQGAGTAATVLRCVNPEEETFVVLAGHDISISNLTLDGNRRGRLTGGKDAMGGTTLKITRDVWYRRQETRRVRVSNCRVLTNGFDAIGVVYAGQVLIERCWADSRDSGIDIVNGASDVTVRHCEIHNTGLFGIPVDADNDQPAETPRRIVIEHNTVVGYVGSRYGIGVETGENVSIRSNTLTTVATPEETWAIRLYDNARFVTVENNTVTNLSGSNTGIQMTGSPHYAGYYADERGFVVRGNTFRGQGSGKAIEMYGLSAAVSGNRVSRYEFGVRFVSLNVPLNAYIQGNQVSNCSLSYAFQGDYTQKSNVWATANASAAARRFDWAIDPAYVLHTPDTLSRRKLYNTGRIATPARRTARTGALTATRGWASLPGHLAAGTYRVALRQQGRQQTALLSTGGPPQGWLYREDGTAGWLYRLVRQAGGYQLQLQGSGPVQWSVEALEKP